MEYNELLNLTLELEGLLLVKLRRDKDAPVETDRLIADKIARINAVCPATALSDDDAIAATVEMEEDEDADEAPQPVTVAPAAPSVEEAPVESPKEIATPASVADTTHIEPSVNDVTHAFTLNDKFRFRRELFHNSDADLNETLDILQAMDSLDEAEDYLYNDLAWDAGDPEVKAFIALISHCWSK